MAKNRPPQIPAVPQYPTAPGLAPTRKEVVLGLPYLTRTGQLVQPMVWDSERRAFLAHVWNEYEIGWGEAYHLVKPDRLRLFDDEHRSYFVRNRLAAMDRRRRADQQAAAGRRLRAAAQARQDRLEEAGVKAKFVHLYGPRKDVAVTFSSGQFDKLLRLLEGGAK